MPSIQGVPVTGTIVPTSTSDTYPVIDPVYGIDGWRSVASHAIRDAIPAGLLRQGMVVYTQNDGLMWQYNGSAFVAFAPGGGSGSGQTFTFGLAPGTNLAVGTNLFGTSIAVASTTLAGIDILLTTNPSGSGGGATFDIWKNGASILSAPASIAAGVTTVTAVTPATAGVSAGDLFTVNVSGVGTGVQGVKIVLYGSAAVGQVFSFGLAPGANLAAGTNLFGTAVATAAKTLTGYKILLGTNPSGAGGGATFDVRKNGTSILSAPVAVAAGTTTVTSGAPATTAVAQGDLFTVNTSSVGTGVQNVKIVVF